MGMDILAALLFVGLSVAGLLIVRGRVPLALLEEHHEVAGICFAVVGGLYGIILAFVMVSSWERYETARQDTETEASAAADLYRHSAGFGEPARTRIGNAVLAYVESVVNEEFPAIVELISVKTPELRIAPPPLIAPPPMPTTEFPVKVELTITDVPSALLIAPPLLKAELFANVLLLIFS